MGEPERLLSAENWPTADQRRLLRAALLEGDAARREWEEWRAGNDLLRLDDASFFVLPPLLRNLRRIGVAGELPVELRSASRFTWCKNQLATESFVAVVRLLEGAGIPAVLLKGAPLVLFHYRDFGARMMNDVDVLVREEHLPAAAALLEASGWTPTEPLPPADVRPWLHAVSFTHPRWLELDLHWRPFSVDCPAGAEERFRRRITEREVRGTRVRVPDATDLLLLTCYHARKPDAHSVCRWVIDAATIVGSADPPVDFDALFERARDAGLLAPVRDAVTCLARDFGLAVPEASLRRAWRVPVPAEERHRYERIRAGPFLADRGFRWRFDFHWSSYVGVSRRLGRRPGAAGFLRYLLAFHRWYYKLDRRREVPLRAAARLAERFRRRWSEGPRAAPGEVLT